MKLWNPSNWPNIQRGLPICNIKKVMKMLSKFAEIPQTGMLWGLQLVHSSYVELGRYLLLTKTKSRTSQSESTKNEIVSDGTSTNMPDQRSNNYTILVTSPHWYNKFEMIEEKVRSMEEYILYNYLK